MQLATSWAVSPQQPVNLVGCAAISIENKIVCFGGAVLHQSSNGSNNFGHDLKIHCFNSALQFLPGKFQENSDDYQGLTYYLAHSETRVWSDITTQLSGYQCVPAVTSCAAVRIGSRLAIIGGMKEGQDNRLSLDTIFVLRFSMCHL